jgi:hypothetical protein
MSPYKQRALGISDCRLALGGSVYPLRDGSETRHLAVPVSLLHAEPSLRRHFEAMAISPEEALEMGYRFVRSYDEAMTYGLA